MIVHARRVVILPGGPVGLPLGDDADRAGRAARAWSSPACSPADIDVLVPHQANLRIVEAIAKRLRAKGAREDMVVADDIVYSGNTSSASIPMALDHMRAAGRVHSGDVALLVGFGAGLSYAGQVVICP